jgi:hypothetical protein
MTAGGKYPSKPPAGWLGWAMLLLAIGSVLLLGWVTFFSVATETHRIVVFADYAVCAIFALEFLWRWRRDGWRWKFPLIYWYEVLGMVPLSDPAFRSFRLLRIVVVLARVGRAVDRAFGERITAAFVNRFVGTIVRVIKRPVTIAVIDEVAAVLRTGHYTRNIAAALRENRYEMDEMLVELIHADPTMSRLRYVPFHDDIVRLIADTSFRIVFEILEDPRTDELVSDLLRENLDQISGTVRGKMVAERAAEPEAKIGLADSARR